MDYGSYKCNLLWQFSLIFGTLKAEAHSNIPRSEGDLKEDIQEIVSSITRAELPTRNEQRVCYV